MCPGTHKNWILLHSANFTRECWQPRTNMDFIWELLQALMAAWLLECRCSYLWCAVIENSSVEIVHHVRCYCAWICHTWLVLNNRSAMCWALLPNSKLFWTFAFSSVNSCTGKGVWIIFVVFTKGIMVLFESLMEVVQSHSQCLRLFYLQVTD